MNPCCLRHYVVSDEMYPAEDVLEAHQRAGCGWHLLLTGQRYRTQSIHKELYKKALHFASIAEVLTALCTSGMYKPPTTKPSAPSRAEIAEKIQRLLGVSKKEQAAAAKLLEKLQAVRTLTPQLIAELPQPLRGAVEEMNASVDFSQKMLRDIAGQTARSAHEHEGMKHALLRRMTAAVGNWERLRDSGSFRPFDEAPVIDSFLSDYARRLEAGLQLIARSEALRKFGPEGPPRSLFEAIEIGDAAERAFDIMMQEETFTKEPCHTLVHVMDMFGYALSKWQEYFAAEQEPMRRKELEIVAYSLTLEAAERNATWMEQTGRDPESATERQGGAAMRVW